MSLVEHLTGCLEESQCREKEALQRCSELEMAVLNQASAASRRSGDTFPSVSCTSVDALDSAASQDEKERSETSAPVLLAIYQLFDAF